jgi:hypothetical protein
MNRTGCGSFLRHKQARARGDPLGCQVAPFPPQLVQRAPALVVVQYQSGRTAWGHFHDHFHNRFRHRNFFAFGFGGPIYDYAYSSCWSWVPTRSGWQWLYVCGDYYGY